MPRLNKLATFAGTRKVLFEYNDYTRNGLRHLIENHVMFIAERGDQLIGFIGGYFISHPFNPSVRMLSEALYWVDEEFRKTRAGLLLMNKFIAFGKEKSDWVVFGLNEKTNIKESKLLKRGFRLHEKCYLLEVN